MKAGSIIKAICGKEQLIAYYSNNSTCVKAMIIESYRNNRLLRLLCFPANNPSAEIFKLLTKIVVWSCPWGALRMRWLHLKETLKGTRRGHR